MSMMYPGTLIGAVQNVIKTISPLFTKYFKRPILRRDSISRPKGGDNTTRPRRHGKVNNLILVPEKLGTYGLWDWIRQGKGFYLGSLKNCFGDIFSRTMVILSVWTDIPIILSIWTDM
jgi:hypothetical protein